MSRIVVPIEVNGCHFELEATPELVALLRTRTNFEEKMTLPLLPVEDLAEPTLTEWRPGQAELVSLIWFLHGFPGARIYVDAPTGSGKSAIVRGLVALEEYNAKDTLPTVVLTADHALQEQYVQFRRFKSLTGRPNWPCTLDPTVTAEKAICATGEIERKACEHFRKGECAYYAQATEAVENGAFVTNYHWWAQSRKNQGYEVGLTICDEAHALEDILREDQTARLNYPASDPDPADWYKWLEEELQTQHILWQDIDQLFDQAVADEDEATRRRMRAHRTRIERAISRTQTALSNLRQRADETVIYREGGKVCFSPLRVNLADEITLHNAILLSATMPDPALVDRNPYAMLIRVPSTFPKERRPVVPLNTVRLGRNSGEEDYQKLAQEVDRRLLQHSAGKGLVHTTSFAIADAIKKYSTNPGMLITHGPGDRDAAIAAFKAAPAGRVLLSPSAAQGVDLPYDQCSWQMIAKLPFPFLGDPVAKARMDRQPKLSAQDTALQIIQAAGRGMRAPDDECVTYIADGNWAWFFQQNEELFPAWFKEAIVKNS